MRIARFLITVLLGYVTASGYAAMQPGMLRMWGLEWPWLREVLIDVAALTLILSVVALFMWRLRPAYERAYLFMSTLTGYVCLVCATIAVEMRPEFSTFQRVLLLAFFGFPFIVAAFNLAHEKYNQHENVPA